MLIHSSGSAFSADHGRDSFRLVDGPTVPVLRRDVHDVRVVVGLGRQVARPLFEGLEPGVKPGVVACAADLEVLPVEQGRDSVTNLSPIFHANDQTLEGSISAVSKRNFATKYSFCNIFRDLQD